jgi:hypothetical protein
VYSLVNKLTLVTGRAFRSQIPILRGAALFTELILLRTKRFDRASPSPQSSRRGPRRPCDSRYARPWQAAAKKAEVAFLLRFVHLPPDLLGVRDALIIRVLALDGATDNSTGI